MSCFVPTGGLGSGELTVGFTVCDSPAKRKPEEDSEKAKSDDSVDEEEKDQVGLAFKFLNSAFFLLHLLVIVNLYLVYLWTVSD